MIDHVHALPEGYQLQEYTITGTLGFGGFGITYRAYDNNLDAVVAIKEYLPSELAVRLDGSTVSAKSEQDKDSFEWGLDSFLKEARTVFKFDHPNIIRIYRFFEQNGTGYIVMDYVDGRPLSSILDQAGTLEEAQIRQWLWPIMDGLKVVHEAGYLHRDIKPPNIMIRKDGRPILLDFGAARLAMKGRTRSLTAIMTPGFAPIEQYASRGNQGPWTDIYALGAVMYRCIAGKKPLDAMDRVLDDSLSLSADEFAASYSQGLINGIRDALAFRETDRPRHLDEWMAIMDAGDGKAAAPTPDLAEAPTRKMPAKTEDPTRKMPSSPIIRKETTQPAPLVEPPKSQDKAQTPHPATGEIRVKTIPIDANVYLNGKEQGRAPRTITGLKVGLDYSVRVEAKGYEPRYRRVKASRDLLELNLELSPIERWYTKWKNYLVTSWNEHVVTKRKGLVVTMWKNYLVSLRTAGSWILSPLKRISQKWKVISITSVAIILVLSWFTWKTVELRGTRHGVSSVQSNQIPSMKRTQYGTFRVLTNPVGADVYVDGHFKGRAPLTIQNVSIGKQVRIEVRAIGYESQLRTETVKAIPQVELKFDLLRSR